MANETGPALLVSVLRYEVRLRLAVVVILLFVVGASSATARTGVYRSASGPELRFTLHTPPCISAGRRFPVWIYQEGDGNVRYPYAAWRASLATALLASTYNVVVVWPELRREKLASMPERYCELDFFHRIEDANAVIDAVKQLPFVDARKVFLIGSSAGSEVAALTAAGRNDIAGVVTIGGGVLSLGDYLRETGELASILPNMNNKCESGTYDYRSGLFWKQLLESGYTQTLRSTAVPTLILLGARDTITRCDITAPHAEELSRTNPRIKYECVPYMEHGLGSARVWRWKRVSDFTRGVGAAATPASGPAAR